jgi:hypothetical protein
MSSFRATAKGELATGERSRSPTLSPEILRGLRRIENSTLTRISHPRIFRLQLLRRHLTTGEAIPIPLPVLGLKLSNLSERHSLSFRFLRFAHCTQRYRVSRASRRLFWERIRMLNSPDVHIPDLMRGGNASRRGLGS